MQPVPDNPVFCPCARYDGAVIRSFAFCGPVDSRMRLSRVSAGATISATTPPSSGEPWGARRGRRRIEGVVSSRRKRNTGLQQASRLRMPRSQQGPPNPFRAKAARRDTIKSETRRRTCGNFLVTIICAAPLYSQSAGNAPFGGLTADASSCKPAGACKELRSLTSLELSVIGTTVIPASASTPEHCRVSLMAQPELNIEANLPSAWNGRLYMFGNGGWAGEAFDTAGRAASRAKGLKAGFVTAATDTGHSAALEPGASFALNRQKLLDFGFRSLHVTAETAKMLAQTYYGAGPTKAERATTTQVLPDGMSVY